MECVSERSTGRPNIIVLGAQYGSEGKGEVVAELTRLLKPKCVVRIGGPQAGHSVTQRRNDGGVMKHQMRQVPCGFLDPEVELHIAPGSEVQFSVLENELSRLSSLGMERKVMIDARATVLNEAHISMEVDDAIVMKTGSTFKGVGRCRAERLMRRHAGTVGKLEGLERMEGRWFEVVHGGHGAIPPRWLNEKVVEKASYETDSIIETAQGYGLSNVNANTFPYCTSCEVNPAAALSACALPSRLRHGVLAVVRTHPIRIAGDSGPLLQETSWSELGVEPEQTTVTRKTRRVGKMEFDALEAMKVACRPDAIVVTFMDYVQKDLAGMDDINEVREKLDGKTAGFLGEVSTACGAKVVGLGTGPGIVAWNYEMLARIFGW